ncbi:Uncharacterised protein family (UPF0158) [Rhizobiales bacterium GAS191]|nr:Uncharacterised protein family (UPF0158) [Rhizobiales bacterium GAS188]SED14554.1 Uncharacterised protein family (UPF0158) [Rhizobiales bacterium GAS191]
MPVSFKDLEFAFDFVSSGRLGENQAYISKETGKTYWRSDYMDESVEELPEDIDDGEKYLEVPHKNDLDLGRTLVFDFVAAALPDDYEKVRDIFRSKGAYARFKDLLGYRKAVDRWHEFEAKATQDALRAWCKENAIELAD